MAALFVDIEAVMERSNPEQPYEEEITPGVWDTIYPPRQGNWLNRSAKAGCVEFIEAAALIYDIIYAYHANAADLQGALNKLNLSPTAMSKIVLTEDPSAPAAFRIRQLIDWNDTGPFL